MLDAFILPKRGIVKVVGSGSQFENFSSVDQCRQIKLSDIDFVVQMSRDEIVDIVKNRPGTVKEFKLHGNTVSTVFVNGVNDNKLYHVDLMPSKNIDDEAWIMTGGSPSIKGVTRNILLCFLARLKSESETDLTGRETKWTISFPGGIGVRFDGEKKTLERDTSPATILNTLGLPSGEKMIELTKTFEGLSQVIPWNEEMIERFIDYSKSQWLYKANPDVIDAAINHLLKSQQS